jgi:hypothetical protein
MTAEASKEGIVASSGLWLTGDVQPSWHSAKTSSEPTYNRNRRQKQRRITNNLHGHAPSAAVPWLSLRDLPLIRLVGNP